MSGTHCLRGTFKSAKFTNHTLDAIITEMNHRFNEDPFSKFDIDKIARLTEIYDQDFSNADPSNIRDQLETFILHVPRIDDFVGCHYFGSLAIKIVETEKNVTFPLV
uniref:Uncharacterized protein n=1 Tax=Oryza sativa subsp. japonica TaxID=39947 RepID=Q2R4V9_ORYSJ|nr:hypothetical protein LOC_Os11g27130 [Oryza sativa Japonica Group]